jgi:hypothetical protein
MHLHVAGAVAALIASGTFLAGPAQDVAWEEASLTAYAPNDWAHLIPDEEWFSINGPIFIGSFEFATEAKNETKILVATTAGGDPKTGVSASGDILKLKGETSEGERFTYAIRVRGGANGGFEWSPAGIRTGTVEGKKIMLFDRNGNGIYNDLGQDAISVGNSKGAALFGRVLMVDDALFHIEVDEQGNTLRYRPYDGETGVIDVTSEFGLKADLESAVFSTAGGDMSFDLSGTKGEVRVPVGSYELTFAFVAKGSDTAKISRGKMEMLPVTAEQGALLEWGSELAGAPMVRRGGAEVTISPEYRIYGNGGEEYYDFTPDPLPSQYEIKDAESDKRLKKGSLPTG